MTPAEQARAEVEAWWRRCFGDTRMGVMGYESKAATDLIARLTPVFERAQVADRLKERPDPMWVCPIPEHGQCAELCFECCLSLIREASEETQADNITLRERAERAEAALEGKHGNKGWDILSTIRAEQAERLRTAEADVARLRDFILRLSKWCRWSRCPSPIESVVWDELVNIIGAEQK